MVGNADMRSFLCGALAGCTATAFTYPFDVIRTQVAINKFQNIGSTLKSIIAIYKSRGIKGYWNGLNPAIVQIAPYMGLNFMIFNGMKRRLHRVFNVEKKNRPISSLVDITAGSIAGMISKTCVMPLDVIKRRLQVTPRYHLIFCFNIDFD
jgi:hypothetical protein